MSEETLQSGFQQKRISRRELLVLSWFGLATALAAKLIDLGVKLATPSRKAGTLGGVFHLGAAADLPKAGEAPLSVPEGRFWLVSTEAGLVALYKTCTHLDCLYDWNSVSETFVCPCHGSEFSIDGNYLKGPAGRSLDHFVVRLVDSQGQVVAETNEASGAPLPMPVTGISEDGEVAENELFVEVDTGRKILGAPLDSQR
jgi:cytochrome b6-f complex iron-sulfur subunit